MDRPIKPYKLERLRIVAVFLIVCLCNSGPDTFILDASAQGVPESADIFFSLNEYGVQPEGESLLRERIAELKNDPGLIIVIEGYSDITGEEEYNLSLSRRRAESVRNYFVNQGIEPERISVRGKGKTDKFAGGLAEESLSQNRRVRVIFDIARSETPPPAPVEEDTPPATAELAEVDPEETIVEIASPAETAADPAAEPPPPAVTESVVQPPDLSDAIESAMRKLAPGRIVFETPGRMNVGESYVIEADLSYSFVRELSKSLNSVNAGDDGRVRLGRDVGVYLSGHGFDIRPVMGTDSNGGADGEFAIEDMDVIKTVKENSTAKWFWQVTPLKSGFRSLLLSVEVMVEDSPYNETGSEYPIFQRVIDVKSNFLYSVTSSYLIMAVFIIVVIAGVGWVLIKKFSVR